MAQAVVLSTGRYLPSVCLRTREMESLVFESQQGESYHIKADEVIEKTGIEERHLAAENESTSDLAMHAGRHALERAGLHPDAVDLVLLATGTPDYPIPATAPIAARKMGMHGVAAYDIGRGGTSFLEAFEFAAAVIMAGRYERVLVIGADKCSAIVNPRNKATATLYGDGAGAVLLGAETTTRRGFLHAVAGSQGDDAEKLFIPVGGSRTPVSATTQDVECRLHADPEAVAAYGKQVLAMGVERVLAEKRLGPEALDLLIPQQTNLRLIEAACRALDLPMEKVLSMAAQTGNTGAASLPIALDEAERRGLLKPDSLVALAAFGAGFTWMATLLRF